MLSAGIWMVPQFLTYITTTIGQLCAVSAPTDEMSANCSRALEDLDLMVDNRLATNPDGFEKLIQETVVAYQLQGLPRPPAPQWLYRRQGDSGYKVARSTKGIQNLPPLPPIKAVHALLCPVCNNVNMMSVSDPRPHPLLLAWAGISVPVCTACTMSMQRENDSCMACCRNKLEVAVRREDCHAVLLLCPPCRGRVWLTKLEEAGLKVDERSAISGRPLQMARVLALKNREQLAMIPEALKRAGDSVAEPDVEHRDKRVCDAVIPPIPYTDERSCLCGNAGEIRCCHGDCDARKCMECTLRAVGGIQSLANAVAQRWYCAMHRGDVLQMPQ